MHKVRAAAHRSAWFATDGDAKPNYNPFRKTMPRHNPSSIHDVEKGPQGGNMVRGGTYRSADFEPHSTEVNRMSQFGPDHIGTQHAQTMPLISGGADPQVAGSSRMQSEADPKETKETSENSSATRSDTLVPDDQAGPRQRKLNTLLTKFHVKPGEKDIADPKRTPTSSTKSQKKKFTFASQIRATLLNSWINVLLVMAPVGIIVYALNLNPIAIFVCNFIAIIPLAAMLSYATEEIALRTGETIGGLLNASFGNAVELIVSIIALAQKQVLIVQTSLIGSILSNLLLVMGMCFFFGGLDRPEQHFNQTVAQTASSLLALAVASLIIPTAFSDFTSEPDQSSITSLSRGTSVLLLLVYGAYLYFQLKTHADLYNKPSEKVAKRSYKVDEGDSTKNIARMGAVITSMGGAEGAKPTPQEADETPEPELSVFTACFTLAAATALVGVCAEFMVGSIDSLTGPGSGLSKTFVGLILLPIVGNAAEHATAVTVACKDKMDLAIGVAVGSSMQIALFVLPLVVVIGWILNQPLMTLSFDGFQISVLFVAVLLVNYLISDGKSHWLEGILLQTLYFIIAIAAWYYPEPTVA